MYPLSPENRVPLSHELRAELTRLAGEHGLDHHADAWLSEATLCVRLDLDAEADQGVVGASRYAGCPDLLRGVDWPSGRDGAFVFLQQVNLAEVPTFPGNPLPTSGLLSLFLEGDEQSGGGGGAFHVLYHNARSDEFVRAELPGELVPAHEDYTDPDLQPFRLQLRLAVSLPLDGVAYQALHEHCGDDWQKIYDVERAAFGGSGRESVGGRLLGHPYGVQCDQVTHAILIHHDKRDLVYAYYKTEDEVQADLAAAIASGDERRVAHQQRIAASHPWLRQNLVERERDRWLPLWQVESNFQVGTCFWDAGTLSTYVLREDLARGDFSRVYTELESS